jgi:hypothetical protein
MSEKIQLSGLCINCFTANDCVYHLNQTQPIIFCEEFSCTDPSGSEKDVIRVIPKIENVLNSTQKGICSNCENIETCTLQRTEGNVINCEEYK